MPQDAEMPLVETRRKEIFQWLVDSQDQGNSVAQSRVLTAQRFEVSEAVVRSIEREGIDNEWPPLG